MKNEIHLQVELQAPSDVVWKAITNHNEFGEWFKVKIEAPFVAGKISKGFITHPGYEHIPFEVTIQKILPQTLFSFTWHPFAIDPTKDYSNEEPTLVEFRLLPTANGTLLLIRESGFEKLPDDRVAKALEMNERGWMEQIKNIKNYIGDLL